MEGAIVWSATRATISLAVWSAVADASIPSNLFLSVVVKLLSVWEVTEKSNVPSESWYVTVIPDSVLLETIAPTISCTCSLVRVAVIYPAPLVSWLLFVTFVAEAEMPFNFVNNASVKAFVSDSASYKLLICAPVWSAVAPVSIPSNLLPSADTSRPSTLPDTAILPVTPIPPDCISNFVAPPSCSFKVPVPTSSIIESLPLWKISSPSELVP